MSKPQPTPTTLTDRVRRWTAGLWRRLGATLARLGVHPDAVTIAGMLLVGVAGLVIAGGDFVLGGVIFALGGLLDAVDGAVARARPRPTRFGAVLDSTLDRYSDGFVFIGLAYAFAVEDRFVWMLLALAALLGSLLVSYVRARAEAADINVKASIGFFTRLERGALIVLLLLVPPLLEIGVLVLALGTHLTALQRLLYVRRALSQT